MVQPSQQFASAKTETEVAVLQVQFQNLNEKVDDLKTDLQDIRDSMEKHSE
jgi:predicted  nucleic acid-binding Zn-ribbon protein